MRATISILIVALSLMTLSTTRGARALSFVPPWFPNAERIVVAVEPADPVVERTLPSELLLRVALVGFQEQASLLRQATRPEGIVAGTFPADCGALGHDDAAGEDMKTLFVQLRAAANLLNDLDVVVRTCFGGEARTLTFQSRLRLPYKPFIDTRANLSKLRYGDYAIKAMVVMQTLQARIDFILLNTQAYRIDPQ